METFSICPKQELKALRGSVREFAPPSTLTSLQTMATRERATITRPHETTNSLGSKKSVDGNTGPIDGTERNCCKEVISQGSYSSEPIRLCVFDKSWFEIRKERFVSAAYARFASRCSYVCKSLARQWVKYQGGTQPAGPGKALGLG